MVTFVLHPNWYAARTESKWDTNDIRCITVDKEIAKNLASKPTTEESNSSIFDVGGGLEASRNERTFAEFSHNLNTTIERAATNCVRAITAKHTRNNIDYDASMWRTAVNVPVEVKARRALNRSPFTVFTKS